MKLSLAFLVWFGMAFVIAKGVVMAVHGTTWLMWTSVAVFTLLMIKVGCLSHD